MASIPHSPARTTTACVCLSRLIWPSPLLDGVLARLPCGLAGAAAWLTAVVAPSEPRPKHRPLLLCACLEGVLDRLLRGLAGGVAVEAQLPQLGHRTAAQRLRERSAARIANVVEAEVKRLPTSIHTHTRARVRAARVRHRRVLRHPLGLGALRRERISTFGSTPLVSTSHREGISASPHCKLAYLSSVAAPSRAVNVASYSPATISMSAFLLVNAFLSSSTRKAAGVIGGARCATHSMMTSPKCAFLPLKRARSSTKS